VKVTGLRLAGAAAMNDALLSDAVDIAVGGANGLFILWSKTVGTQREVRAISALNSMSYLITSTDPDIRSIADLGKCRKIAVPAIKVSSPALTIQRAAVKLYGLKEFDRFDPLTVSLSPADTTVALLSGASEINCGFAMLPFVRQQLEDPRIHEVTSFFEMAGGPTTFTLAYTSKRFHDSNPKLYQAVYDALAEATDRVSNDIRAAAQYWIEDSNSKLTVDYVAAAASGKDIQWTMIPQATIGQAEFMYDIGTIKVKPKSWKDYFFPEAYGLPGS
jgi:NitT/TauT family transport system substrate-binding protein